MLGQPTGIIFSCLGGRQLVEDCLPFAIKEEKGAESVSTTHGKRVQPYNAFASPIVGRTAVNSPTFDIVIKQALLFACPN